MWFPLRLLAVLALALQAAFGSAHLVFGVCHGELRLPALDGSACCAPADHCAEDGCTSDGVHSDADGSEHTDAPCSDCFELEVVLAEDPMVPSISIDVPPATTSFVALPAVPLRTAPASIVRSLDARGPPHPPTPTGLLPGVFPLRI